VYSLGDGRALVLTVDFITPPVDDPYWFGQIAAANAISDVYAMGGRPLLALNLVMFPFRQLGVDVLREILRGASSKVNEAGAVLAGGHSIEDEEPKFGLCVVGEVNEDEVLRNRGAEPGDVLILTKPLGTGVLFNAVRSGRMEFSEIEKILPKVAALNDGAARILKEEGAKAVTDVTGFGLAGHLFEMCSGGELTALVNFGALPHYPGALSMYRKGETTGSNRANREFLGDEIAFRGLSPEEEELLFDPQTSGGLLASVPRENSERALDRLKESGYGDSSVIGEIVPWEGVAISVISR